MARRWRGSVLAGVSTVLGAVLLHASSRGDGRDVQPWLWLAWLGATVGGGLAVFDSSSRTSKQTQQPTEEERRNW